MKKTIALILATVLILACSACTVFTPKPAIIGEWTLEKADIGTETNLDGSLDATLTVNEDKFFTLSMSMKNGEVKSVYDIDGTCTEEKGAFTFNSKHSASKTGTETSDSTLNESFTGTIADNKLTLTLPGATMTFVKK